MQVMTETQAEAIRKRNTRYQTKEDKRRLELRRQIELMEEAREIGVTVEELTRVH